MELSFIEDVGEYASSCGYCRCGSDGSSVSHGMWGHRITVRDYQELIDRGWRRSGCWLYKPRMDRTCCPQYTIRLKAKAFELTKEHRKVLGRVQRFASGELVLRGEQGQGHEQEKRAAPEAAGPSGRATTADGVSVVASALARALGDALEDCMASGLLPRDAAYPSPRVAPPSAKALKAAPADLTTAFALGAAAAARKALQDAQEPQAAAVAELLLARLALPPGVRSATHRAGHINFSCADGGAGPSSSAASPPSVAGGGGGGGGRKKRPKASSDGDATRAEAAAVASMISASAPAPPPGSHSHPPASSTVFGTGDDAGIEVITAANSFVEEEFELWKRYQAKVHGETPEDLTRESFQRFLVDTPLVAEPLESEAGPHRGEEENGHSSPSSSSAAGPLSAGFGSFHQQYRVRGKLVAVGVVDVLPRGLSSKYLFWDPDLAKLSLGKYTALQEIAWVAAAQARCSTFQFYYLGFYIHNCAKMRYKAQYKPSQLLCPRSYEWVPYEEAEPLLNEAKYSVLAPFSAAPARETTLLSLALPRVNLFVPGRGLLPFEEAERELEAPPAALARLGSKLRVWLEVCGPKLADRIVYVAVSISGSGAGASGSDDGSD
mmetsp:Transcript_20855/g.67523  ORF Transcript_20855/g.67523 Transcript_20855/m.67523 type:complete len:609 (+) Transcript_20855:755-2581(+)